MVDILKMNRDKDKILSTIRMRGPSLPVQIAKSVGISPLFASAFLSELRGEEKLKISDMKVGSSPLYYIPGQEPMLENFVEHLNQKERQAFRLLKDNKMLSDEEQTPVIRVALRAIKDFAVPIRVKNDGNEKLFWKYFSVEDKEFEAMVTEKVLGKKDSLKPIKEDATAEENAVEKVKEELVEKAEKEEVELKSERTEEELNEKKKGKTTRPKKKKEKVKEEDSDFLKEIKDYLSQKDIEVLEILLEKKREFVAKIRIDSLFGKQEYHLTAKDKKSVSDNDLVLAMQMAQSHKMPALVVSKGDLNKKGKEYMDQWGNLVKFERIIDNSGN